MSNTTDFFPAEVTPEERELFAVAPSLSPIQAFIEKHGIETFEPVHPGQRWIAVNGTTEAKGSTRNSAVYTLAAGMDLEGWATICWED